MTPEAPHQAVAARRPPTVSAAEKTSFRRWLAPGGAALALLLLVGGGWFWLRKADPDAVWNAAEASLQLGQIDDAEAAVKRLARLRDPTPLDWMLRGQVHLAKGRREETLEALAHVPDGHWMAPQARLMAGRTERQRHRVRFAEHFFREAVRLDPGLVAAHKELIYIYGYQLRREKLAAEFQTLEEITELTFDNVFHWCLLRSALWDPDTAVDELELFIKTDPDDRWSRLALADNYRRMTRLDEAEAVLAPLPESDVQARVVRVLLAMDRNQEDRAEKLLNEGPEDDPRLAQLKGRLALARRDGPTAVRCFRTAYAGLPDDRDALFGLINALTLIGDNKAAEPLREVMKRHEALNTLIQKASTTGQSKNAPLLRDLGAACAALGRIPEARAWYKVAIALDPLDTKAQQALFQLGERTRGEHSASK